MPEGALPAAARDTSPSAGTWSTSSGSETLLDGSLVEKPEPAPTVPATAWSGVVLLERFAGDQKAIWTSPLHLRRSDAIWGLPALAGLGAFLASDSWFSRQVPAGEVARSRSLSNYGAFSLAGAAGGMFLMGKITHHDHAAETGFLASEAALNAVAADYALKSMFQRQRPYDGNGSGHFFAGGSSFPSEHATVSWAVAGVVAHEYPGTLTKLFSYGLASAVSVARVTGKEHYPSDVIAGGALGYFIARQVYQRHRDPEVSEAAWGSLIETNPQPTLTHQDRDKYLDQDKLDQDKLNQYKKAESRKKDDKVRRPQNMGSSYVPPDSWVYPQFERLAALGYIHSAYLGIRPWTRMQCARFLEEARESLRYEMANGEGLAGPAAARDIDGEAANLFTALGREFAAETRRLDGAANEGLELDSTYERTTSIAGHPLADGYHFAQTLINDYGRPYGQGFNGVSGLTAHGEAGPFSFYLQGEYQHSAALPAYSPSVQQAIAEADFTAPLDNGRGRLDRLQLLNSSVAFTFKDTQFSFGRQSNWWGPGDSGPFLASDNAAPIPMFQIASMVPVHIPLVSDVLGPAQSVFFVGQLRGQSFDFNDPNLLGPGFHPQPFIHGNKVSFKPTPNLEFGMGVTAIFGGPGLPFTWSEFLRSYYSHKNSTALNPAKRFSGFDISYRVPGLRRWLTVYTDSTVGDEISPIGSSRPMLNPGLYFPQVPKIPRLELRVEGVKDPFTNIFAPGFIYYDRRYRSGYTNEGNLIGSWVGRDGFGAQGQATYWLSSQSRLQCGYRYQEADRSFLAGGRLADYSLRAETRLKSGFAVSGFVQYEQWMFPLLSASRQANVTSSLQITFYPNWGGRN